VESDSRARRRRPHGPHAAAAAAVRTADAARGDLVCVGDHGRRVLYLGATVNLLTAALAALTFASYVLLYTPLKRKTSLNTSLARAWRTADRRRWTAAGGSLGAAVAALFWILFLWQLPHFLALAWLYREDYRASGLRMLSVADDDGRETGRMALLYAMALLPISCCPRCSG